METKKELVPELAYYSRQPSSSQLIKYQQLHFMHKALFESKIAKGVGHFIFKASLWENTPAAKALLKLNLSLSKGLWVVKVVVNVG